jgi:hypothetical protein
MPSKLERVNPDSESGLSRPWHGRPALRALPGLLNHTRKTGVPSWTLTSNLTLRTRRLYALSYGDEMVRASGNAPELGTDLVRLRL